MILLIIMTQQAIEKVGQKAHPDQVLKEQLQNQEEVEVYPLR